MAVILETRKLTKSYGKNRGIVDVDLTVNGGDVFGFIGPNGAGKSTMIRLLLGLISKTSGEASLFGLPVGPSQTEILERCGYMPGEAIFYNNMRVRDILDLASGVRKHRDPAYVRELCERLQVDPGRRISELSLGNRKKVSIICAVQHKPELLFLDEPTSGLDPLMQQVFWQILDEQHQAGATIFLSSHILSEVQHHCTRAAIIREGRIIVDDQVENLSRSSARRVTLRGVSAAPALAGILEVHEQTNGVTFLYQGNARQLLDSLQGLPLEDVTITEPELEELFLHFYMNGGAGAGGSAGSGSVDGAGSAKGASQKGGSNT